MRTILYGKGRRQMADGKPGFADAVAGSSTSANWLTVDVKFQAMRGAPSLFIFLGRFAGKSRFCRRDPTCSLAGEVIGEPSRITRIMKIVPASD